MAKITITLEDIIKDDVPQITVVMHSDPPFEDDDADVQSDIATAKQAAIVAMEAMHQFFGADSVTDAKVVGTDTDGAPMTLVADRR